MRHNDIIYRWHLMNENFANANVMVNLGKYLENVQIVLATWAQIVQIRRQMFDSTNFVRHWH